MRHTAIFAVITLTAVVLAVLGATVTQSPKMLTMKIGTAPEAKPVAVEPLPTDESWTRWPTLVY